MDQQPRFRPFVPENVQMREFTARALFLGLILTVILGAANAYLGLRAGITIAATYPAAVVGMAILRTFNGSVLEENITRTAGSIGESVAAGAIFTLPAFLISGAWPSFEPKYAYWKATALMMVGSILGVLFVSLVRRVMVEDPELPFPESVAASEIHKAGRRGAEAAKFLFWNIGFGALIQILGEMQLFAPDKDFAIPVGQLGKSSVRLGSPNQALGAGGVTMASAPTVSPAYIGVGYIIGPELAALQFSGSVADFFPGPSASELFACGIGRRLLVRLSQFGVALHRPPHRGRRHDGGRGLHSVSYAPRSARRLAALDPRSRHDSRSGQQDEPYRAIHEF
jgi:putative OPT family oligopeptide transporter